MKRLVALAGARAGRCESRRGKVSIRPKPRLSLSRRLGIGLLSASVAPRSLNRVRRTAFIVVGLAAMLLTVVAAAIAAISTYYSGGMDFGGYASTCCYYSRDWNRVYRPGGYNFYLGYDSGGSISWVGPDAWDNPFVDLRTRTSAAAWCNNASSDFVTPVTCQTTTP